MIEHPADREAIVAALHEFIEARDAALEKLTALMRLVERDQVVDLLNESHDLGRAIVGLPKMLRLERRP